MKYRMIATWKMAFEGVEKGKELLREGKSAQEAIEKAIHCVENEIRFCSVGYGGLPNKEGNVELDSAFMDGETLGYGAIMAAHNIKNPISVARHLSNRNVNCVLAGRGAEKYAEENGFEMCNMLSEESKERWQERLKEDQKLKAYEGHDTVCMIAKDQTGKMVSGVSTSGLFMKDAGRVGDSPIIGSGSYCDNEMGAAAGTGLGEDIMRGCLSIRILELIKAGTPVQIACDRILDEHMKRMERSNRVCDAISLIAMDKDGNYGATTNIEEFPYIVINDDEEVEIRVATYKDKKHHNFVADTVWLKRYLGD